MTVIKRKDQRVGVFIDAQNLYHSARNLYRSNVNFKKILDNAVGERSLIKAVAYVITTESGEEKTFFEALQKDGIEIKSKELQIFIDGKKKADWDVGIAIDAIRLAPKLDVIILVAGDGDFIPLVNFLKYSHGCQVEVVSFIQSSSSKLIESCDYFMDLSEKSNDYLIRNRRLRRKIKTKSNKKDDVRRKRNKRK